MSKNNQEGPKAVIVPIEVMNNIVGALNSMPAGQVFGILKDIEGQVKPYSPVQQVTKEEIQSNDTDVDVSRTVVD